MNPTMTRYYLFARIDGAKTFFNVVDQGFETFQEALAMARYVRTLPEESAIVVDLEIRRGV